MVCQRYMDDDTKVRAEREGGTVVQVDYRCAEGNEMMHRRCLDFMIQVFCILAFRISSVLAFKTGVNFIL